MVSLAERKRFSEKYLTVPDGGKFKSDNSPWLIEEFWKPLDGFKLWPVDLDSLCTKCKRKAGSIVESYWDSEGTRKTRHKNCAGLQTHPIIMTLISLPRQEGKTVGTVGIVLASLFLDQNEQIVLLAGSDEQAGTLFEKNYAKPIRDNPRLNKRCKIVGNTITVAKSKSEFQFLATSLASTTGGTKTKIIIDEARAVPASVAIPLMPTIFARNGWECPSRSKGHTHTDGDYEDPNHQTHCDTCGERLEPWVAKIIITSSATVLKGGDHDWFNEMCEEATAHPVPNVHVYQSTAHTNPKVAKSVVAGVSDFLSKIESVRDLAEVEFGNTSRYRGEKFLTKAEINAVIDSELINSQGGIRPAVAFLDTSETGDLTSFIIVEDDSLQGESVWHRLVVSHIKVWDPKKMRGKIIDEKMVRTHMDAYIPRFAMVSVRVDTRVMPWAKVLVTNCTNANTDPPCLYRSIIDGVTWREMERGLAWTKFEEVILARRIRMPDNKVLKGELRAARRKENIHSRTDIREGGVNRKRHLDIAEGIAACCFMVHEQLVTAHKMSLSEMRRHQTGGEIVRSLRHGGSRAPRQTKARRLEDQF